MAPEASSPKEKLSSAGNFRRPGKILIGVALSTIGLDVLLAAQVRRDVAFPIVLDCVAQHGVGPEWVVAVRVSLVEPTPLSVVANRAAKIGELVPALPSTRLTRTATTHSGPTPC